MVRRLSIVVVAATVARIADARIPATGIAAAWIATSLIATSLIVGVACIAVRGVAVVGALASSALAGPASARLRCAAAAARSCAATKWRLADGKGRADRRGVGDLAAVSPRGFCFFTAALGRGLTAGFELAGVSWYALIVIDPLALPRALEACPIPRPLRTPRFGIRGLCRP
jgi:hypothetical protein